MILCSCGAGTAQLKQERVHRTGMGAQERAVILLERYVYDNQRKDSEEKEQELTDCLRQEMVSDVSLIETITGHDFRAALFPGMKFENAPRSSEALLDLLKKEDVQNRISAMTVRYLIVVDIQTSGRRSTFQATILDCEEPHPIGEGIFGFRRQGWSQPADPFRDGTRGLFRSGEGRLQLYHIRRRACAGQSAMTLRPFLPHASRFPPSHHHLCHG